MASRTVFRRVLQASRRVQLQRAVVQRSIVTLPHIQKKNTQNVTSDQSYSQLRSLCTKPGEGMVIHIQDENDFQERVLNSPLPVVVDFHASWCGPCKLLGPRLESLVGSRKGKVVLAKCDVDGLEDIAMRYRISSVPTVIGFKNKESKEKFIGLQDDDIIETFLDRLIG
ncbi:thioredoxin, mitochondrial-like isoform X2 [Mercenaria mercenaria]|nr:thioredoxin, mitochondrial-like isoform X2 [Mercenaria mercenaria]XP_045214090.1 thioredoxin, mitochondrial-like isoform X2 [Mercenaria mercenaria]